MDRKIIVLIVTGILCIIAGVVILAYQKSSLEAELNGEIDIEPEPDKEPDQEPDQEPDPEPEPEPILYKPETISTLSKKDPVENES